jgi:hypothetical protein
MNKKDRKKFIKQYGAFTVSLDGIGNGELHFTGVDVPAIYCNVEGNLGDIYYPVFVDNEYTLKYILKYFKNFRISIYIDNSLPYFVFESKRKSA